MHPPAPPSLFSSPLSSLVKTPHHSPQEILNSSPPSNSVQCRSPERACPCGPFKAELKTAVTLVSFELHPVPMLHPVPYPCDTVSGDYIPIAELCKYTQAHVWPDSIHCFCSLRVGGEARSVRFFIPSQGVHQGSPCLVCSDWTPDGLSGCGYFVNLNEVFKGSESLFGTDTIPLSNFPCRAYNRKRATTLVMSNGVHSLAPAVSLSFEPPPSEPRPSGAQDCVPLIFGVKPGSVSDSQRIWSPPPPHDGFMLVENMPIPADSEVKDVFDEMLKGTGVPYHRFMSVIGRCIACDQVMTLPNILTHPCIGRTKEPGSNPSKYPRFLEEKRVLPSAGSRIKKQPGAGQATIEADDLDDNDSDVEVVDKVDDIPTHKRKLEFDSPIQHVIIQDIKKPRFTNSGGPSRMTPVSTQPVRIVDLTTPPTRTTTPVSTQPTRIVDLITPPTHIPTPDSLREVYRDSNEEFIMYEKV